MDGRGPNVGTLVATPRIMRFGAVEEVAWTDQARNGDTVAGRQITVAGTVSGPLSTVAGGWAAADFAPALLSLGGKRTVVFGGIRGTDITKPYDQGRLYAAQSSDGRTWTLAAGALSQAVAAGAYGLGAINLGGEALAAFTASSSARMYWHLGIDPFTAIRPDHATPQLASCCVLSPSLAQDLRTKQVWTSFCSEGSTASSNGYFAVRILPTAGGNHKLPGAGTGTSTLAPDGRVPLVARRGGGLWTAYTTGYPTPTHIRLQNVETGQSLTFDTRAAGYVKNVGLAAGPVGRLWVYWDGAADGSLIHAVRTNAAVTRLGPVRTVAAPGGGAHITNYQLDGEASAGPLTVVVDSCDARVGRYRISATQIDPGLTVVPGRSRVRAGQRFGVRVSDAGAPLLGVRVHLGASSAVTDRRGIAALTVPAGRAPGRALITANLGGYAAASAPVTIT